jgi:hypothetical protein
MAAMMSLIPGISKRRWWNRMRFGPAMREEAIGFRVAPALTLAHKLI